jgi:RNA-directed DNA polymerase
MSVKQQKSQMKLAFMTDEEVKPGSAVDGGTETLIAERTPESLTSSNQLMEEILAKENLTEALEKVKSNKGSPGIDGMSVEELPAYLKEHWSGLRAQLSKATYKPQPVKRVEIPKPDGGVRKLGIPVVLDRFIQQAVMQVLQRYWDVTFSEHSYGFRPNRTAHQAVAQAQRYIAEGYGVVVDLDLEKFFDRVNHDKLMSQIAERVKDKRVLKLIRAYLNAGVMEDGLVSPTEEGTPQGGPLSPLLSNLLLDELDRELERRGHRFVRYADDSNIYVRSERAGQRVMKSISEFITTRLKLKVNEQKSAVGKPHERKFLGFSFTDEAEPKRRIAPKAIDRFKDRVREITNRTRGISLERVVKELSTYLRGWNGYYGYCQTPGELKSLNAWIRRRMRCYIWKQWKTWKARYHELKKRRVRQGAIAQLLIHRRKGTWASGNHIAMKSALPNAYFRSLGLYELAVREDV